MAQARLGDGLDLIRRHKRATAEPCPCLRGMQQPSGPARGDTEQQRRRFARRPAHRDDVRKHGRIDSYGLDLRAPGREVRCRGNGADACGAHVVRVHPAVVAGQHLDLLFGARVRHLQLEQETVELRLGKRVRALVLHGVLCGDHEERIGQRAGGAVDRDLALLHRLQQRRLRLRRRAVDLVGQEQVGEHGALAEAEPCRLPRHELVDALPDDVSGHQVRCELDSAEPHVERCGKALGQQCLGHTRHTLEQHVTVHEQRGDDAGEDAVLPDHHLAHLVAHGQHREPGRRGFRRRRAHAVVVGRGRVLGPA